MIIEQSGDESGARASDREEMNDSAKESHRPNGSGSSSSHCSDLRRTRQHWEFSPKIRSVKSGDFTGLAEDYSNARPDYSPEVLRALIGLLPRPVSVSDFVDVGAGTGIWTRMLAGTKPGSIRAVEPNDDMRMQGLNDSRESAPEIEWLSGTGESTGLGDSSIDLVTMASSFHWVDFDRATSEFARVLRPDGLFCALWNPRDVDASPVLAEIEAHLSRLKPDLVRKSSGRSGVTETLTRRLADTAHFGSVVYLESSHVIRMSIDRYITAWRSVNDVRVQLGDQTFEQFIDFVHDRLRSVEFVDARYVTRAWIARVIK